MPPRRSKAQDDSSFFRRHGNVFLYIPNLIGYCRVVAAFAAFTTAMNRPGLCFTLYSISFVCDELDGRFARMFDQQSTFGAVLDMVTDRVATTCLLAILCMLYSDWYAIFLALLMLDIFSHWFQMYATLALGSSTHKDTNSRNILVRLYYKHRIFMGFCCVCVEVLYLIFYLLAFKEYRDWHPISLPFQYTDARFERGTTEVPFLYILAALTLPGFATKQIVNVAQLVTASSQLMEVDARKSS